MTDVTKPKFDPIALPGQPGYPTMGPRIGEPVPAPTPMSPPKPTPGPMLANKPEAHSPAPSGPPAPAWVKEAIGKLLVPTRTKAVILVAGVALGSGMYAAKLFTGPAEAPTTTAALEPAKPDPTPTPDATPQPLQLGHLTTTPATSIPAPPLTFDNLTVIATPTAADQFRGRDTVAAVPNLNPSRTNTVPDLTVPAVPNLTTSNTASGVNAIPTIDAPALPGLTAPTIRTVDNTAPSTAGVGAGAGTAPVVPAIPGLTNTPPSAPTVPAVTPPPAAASGPPAIPSLDLPAIGGGGVGTAAVTPPAVVTGTTPPAPSIPNLTATPPTPLIVPAPTPTNVPPPAPVIPGLTGGNTGGSIGAGAATPNPLPVMTSPSAAGGFEPVRATPPPAVPVTPRETQTSFDVDVHTVRQGDSYATIAKSYYGDVAFAEALKLYEESRTGRTQGTVHVPPVWVLRKQFPQAVRGEAAVTPAATVPAERTASNTVPATATGWQPPVKGKTYFTPRPMTMREIAKEAFGDDLYWNRVWDLNLNLSTDAVLPQGTKVTLPGDSKVGQ